jgi:hypothetical protein
VDKVDYRERSSVSYITILIKLLLIHDFFLKLWLMHDYESVADAWLPLVML